MPRLIFGGSSKKIKLETPIEDIVAPLSPLTQEYNYSENEVSLAWAMGEPIEQPIEEELTYEPGIEPIEWELQGELVETYEADPVSGEIYFSRVIID